MAHEAQLGVEELEVELSRGRVYDVLPYRLSRATVNQGTVGLHDSRRQARQILGVVRTQLLAGPPASILSTGVELCNADPIDRSPVVVAGNARVLREPHQSVDALVGTGSVPHHVSQAPYSVYGIEVHIVQNSVQRGQIGMYVGDDQVAHNVRILA